MLSLAAQQAQYGQLATSLEPLTMQIVDLSTADLYLP